MDLLKFFGEKIKPFVMRGTGIVNPAKTGIINGAISCIRQNDVNLWFYKKNNVIIAVDTGYINFPNLSDLFKKIFLNPDEVKAVFLTHSDIDHIGGICDGGVQIFPKAKLYLHKNEEALLTGKQRRFYLCPFGLKNQISRSKNYILLEDKNKIDIDGIKVEVIYTPGHTNGHSCYLVDDKTLFSGDCLMVNEFGGYSFFKQLNMDTKLNFQSLEQLRDRVKNKNIKHICTGHSGYVDKISDLFAHINISAKGTKFKPFDKYAPIDVFKMKD